LPSASRRLRLQNSWLTILACRTESRRPARTSIRSSRSSVLRGAASSGSLTPFAAATRGPRDVYEGRKPPPTLEQETIRRAAAGEARGWETPLVC
jgi:hypothetical protein